MSDGVFIRITVDERRIDGAAAHALAAVCPVDIFSAEGERVMIKPEQVDECTLCELCLTRVPAGALIIRKLYKDEQLVSRGEVDHP
jgi:NAD-dependent dihydropyrimidine dehydrogenase PreA subunit